MDWVEVITNLGFPIACVMACALFLYKLVKRWMNEAAERENKLLEANIRNSQALDKVADTILESNLVNKELSETNRLLVDKIDGSLSALNGNVETIGKLLDNKYNKP